MLQNPEFTKTARLSPGVAGKKVIVQGFGNVGYNTAKFLEKHEAIVVGIITIDSAIYNSKGFDVEDVKRYYAENKNLTGYPKAEKQGKQLMSKNQIIKTVKSY
jgi:glutamate dehydrogenase (NAD(P)+)